MSYVYIYISICTYTQWLYIDLDRSTDRNWRSLQYTVYYGYYPRPTAHTVQNADAPGKNITSKSLQCCCHRTLCRTCRSVSCGKPLFIMHSESFLSDCSGHADLCTIEDRLREGWGVFPRYSTPFWFLFDTKTSGDSQSKGGPQSRHWPFGACFDADTCRNMRQESWSMDMDEYGYGWAW